MSQDITPIHTAACDPDDAVVEELRRILALAESGEIRGVILFARALGGELHKTHVGYLSRCDVIAGCELLKHEMIHAAFGAPERED